MTVYLESNVQHSPENLPFFSTLLDHDVAKTLEWSQKSFSISGLHVSDLASNPDFAFFKSAAPGEMYQLTALNGKVQMGRSILGREYTLCFVNKSLFPISGVHLIISVSNETEHWIGSFDSSDEILPNAKNEWKVEAEARESFPVPLRTQLPRTNIVSMTCKQGAKFVVPIVTEVAARSPAAKAGIQVNDLIIVYGPHNILGTTPTDAQPFLNAIEYYRGRVADGALERDRQVIHLDVLVPSGSEGRGDFSRTLGVRFQLR